MDFEILSLLLKAKSKDVVHKICSECISDHHSDAVITTISDILTCSRSDSRALLTSLGHMARHIVSTNLSTSEEIAGVFPESFHKSLKGLLTKISVDLVPFWREIMAENSVGPPRLSSFSWSVATEQKKGEPVCFLNLNIKQGKGGVKSVNSHLSEEALTDMINSLKQVKGQISAMTSGNKIDPVESYLPGPVHLGVVGMFKGRRVKISEVQLWGNLPDIQSILLKVQSDPDLPGCLGERFLPNKSGTNCMSPKMFSC
eukprot:sb/3468517/